MNRILTTLLFTAAITAQTFGQCNATSQTVSTTSTSSICPDGSTSYTVTVDGSEAGFEYLLKDTLTNSVIDGPFAGTGNAIDFNTGNLTRTTTFEVLAQTPPAAGSAFNLGGGIGDFASTANAWDFDYTQGYTLEFVFNGITAPTNFYNSLFSIGGNFLNGNARNDDLEVYFQQNTQNLIVLHDRGQSSLQYNQYTSPASSTDVHIAIVFDPTLSNDPDKMKVYYDGVLQQQTNTDSQITTMTKTQGANWYVGAIKHQDFTNITDLGRGIFDEVRVWNYGRTDAEINANKASCVSASEQGLAHYYRFNTGSGFTAI
ncbi:MAG: LamG-like jellyroll fold domain-containing protein, partial [Ekhidna sp.]